jgi:transcriptional regulator with XRE-family HTH domain
MPSPHPIDIHVGLRIRQRRRLLDMSQQTLGAAVGLSFQMIQRYEDGSTSIPASTLFELARALDVPPSCFFEGPRLTARDPLCTRRVGPRILHDSQSNGEGEYCQGDPGCFAPPRFLNAKRADTRRPIDAQNSRLCGMPDENCFTEASKKPTKN